mmetsp:Transcript_9154/g.20186  ORF Transcript_9154/g.20186 Transcript_9154/m.20186 type:complete len:395 (+) Transcript_9154:30-1214(+)
MAPLSRLLLLCGGFELYCRGVLGRHAEGFIDCRSGEGVTEHAIRKAHRRWSLKNHPDKGGAAEIAAEFTNLRDSFLRDPLRFHIFRAMFDSQDLQPFNGGFALGVDGARVDIRPRDDWPYVEVEVDLDLGDRLSEGGTWTFALALLGASTVHYRGDVAIGGYDVCCDFVKGSRCVRRSRPLNTTCVDSAGEGGSCTDVEEVWDPYVESDCPLPQRFTANVRRPLHLNETGQWGAALQIRDIDNMEVACLAFAFPHRVLEPLLNTIVPVEGPQPPLESEGQQEPEVSRNTGNDTSDIQFKYVSNGIFCEDGADLLEGQVDHYDGVPPRGGANYTDSKSSLFYGSRCREMCGRRLPCRFYTAYSSGWCQLSSRCGWKTDTGDRLARTFEKLVVSDL